MTGLFLINKPAGMTSHDVVDRVRALTKERRVGHAGTLDPFATGLLIILVGRNATREQQRFLNLDKTYVATLRLGATSTTHDPEGKITPLRAPKITEETLETMLKTFTGTFSQMPPQFSAKKVGGKKAYELAREGKKAPLTEKEITIHKLKLHSFTWPHAVIETTVSSGTYIRALARDIGNNLGIGAYLTTLQRTAIGPFALASARTLNEVTVQDLTSLDDAVATLDNNNTL